MLPKRKAWHDNAIEVPDHGAEFFRLGWWRGGQGVTDFAGLGFGHHRPVGQALVIVGQPIDQLMAVAAEFFRRHSAEPEGQGIGELSWLLHWGSRRRSQPAPDLEPITPRIAP